MALLHNRVNQDELKLLLDEETEKRITISFYRYFPIPDPRAFRDELYRQLNALKVFGRIYVATEGINAQVSVPEPGFESLRTLLELVPGLEGLRLNIAVHDDGKSFWVLKIKVRDKIVADGITDPEFSMMNRGRYVDAREFNEMTNDPSTIVIDMRNHYEYEVGHFNSAREIPSDTFRDQLPMAKSMLEENKQSNIIMYCTGGIRCEKASAYLLHNGFANVFHLEGGIINYANQVREQNLENKFIGKNFVFDQRLGERITNDIIAQCHQCGAPADTHINCVNEGCHLLFIQCDSCKEKFSSCCSAECANIIALEPETQKELRKGKVNDKKVFNKAKSRLSQLHSSAKTETPR